MLYLSFRASSSLDLSGGCRRISDFGFTLLSSDDPNENVKKRKRQILNKKETRSVNKKNIQVFMSRVGFPWFARRENYRTESK